MKQGFNFTHWFLIGAGIAGAVISIGRAEWVTMVWQLIAIIWCYLHATK